MFLQSCVVKKLLYGCLFGNVNLKLIERVSSVTLDCRISVQHQPSNFERNCSIAMASVLENKS